MLIFYYMHINTETCRAASKYGLSHLAYAYARNRAILNPKKLPTPWSLTMKTTGAHVVAQEYNAAQAPPQGASHPKHKMDTINDEQCAKALNEG